MSHICRRMQIPHGQRPPAWSPIQVVPLLLAGWKRPVIGTLGTLMGILAGIEGPRRPCPPASPPLLVAYPTATISPSAELFPRQSPESGPRPSPCAVNWHLRRTVMPGRCHGPKIRDSQWLRCWKPNFVEEARKLGQRDVRTTMIYTHVLNRGGRGVRSRADLLGQLPGGSGRYTETM